MERLIRRCTELGYRQMVAPVGGKENGTDLHDERLGFTSVGTSPPSV
jgi:L-amino acid N-acyltransferase YncA